MSDKEKKDTSAQDKELADLLSKAGIDPSEADLGPAVHEKLPVANVGPKVSDVVSAPPKEEPLPDSGKGYNDLGIEPQLAPPAQPGPAKMPWYSALAHGAGQTATLNLNDEIAGGLMNATRPSTREGIPATYVGKDAIDSLRDDEKKAMADQPVANIAGRVAGALPAAYATRGGSLPVQVEANATLLGGQMFGSGEGTVGQRIDQVGQYVAENPLKTAAAVAAPAIVKGLGQGAEAMGQNAQGVSDRLLTQTFMNPAQRAAFVAAKGESAPVPEQVQDPRWYDKLMGGQPGPVRVDPAMNPAGLDALTKLGADAREAGLYKPTSFFDRFRPTSARRVYTNSARTLANSGRKIGELESKFTEQGVNPAVPITGIAKELRDTSQEMEPIPVPGAQTDASRFGQYASALDKNELGLDRTNLPLSLALKTKRYIGDKTNWLRNQNATNADYGEDAARKFVYGGLKDQISKALQSEADQGRVAPQDVSAYQKANKDFSTAATVHDPALKMAERQGDMGLSLKDLAFGMAVSGGPGGALATLASRTGRGLGASTMAAGARAGGLAARGLGKAAQVSAPPMSAIAQAAAQNPNAPKAQIEKAANENLKEQLQNWFHSLLPQK